MKRFRTYVTWSLAVAAVLLSPLFLIFGIVAAVGITLDILDLAGGGAVALALGAPVAFALLYRLTPRQLIVNFFRSRRRVGRAAGLDYAPKSIS